MISSSCQRPTSRFHFWKWKLCFVSSAAVVLCSCRAGVWPQSATGNLAEPTLGNWAQLDLHQDDSLDASTMVVRGNDSLSDEDDQTNADQNEVVQVWHATLDAPSRSHQPAVHSPGDAQLPEGAIYHPPIDQDGTWAPPGIVGPWPRDEYLFDGGDWNVPARVDADFTVRGVELEDTIGHFDTLDGRRVVEPSNRVPIYAPRFAAVRRVSGIIAYQGHKRSAGVELPLRPHLQEDLQIATTTVQQNQAGSQLGSKRSSVFRERTRGLRLYNQRGSAGLSNVLLPYEDFQVIRTGQYDNAEKARLSQGIDAALVWEHKQAVQVVIDGDEVAVSRGFQGPQETLRYERPEGKPRLRVIKIASDHEANPGEIIHFTIRFDNVGNEPIGNVTIIDNLTTRLEYVPDSAECTLNAEFFTQDNEGDSLVLRWEIIDPMQPGDGGVARFQCRVR